jgi:hypothetical protein
MGEFKHGRDSRVNAAYSGCHLYEEVVLGFPLPLRERDRVRGKVKATNLLIQTKSAVIVCSVYRREEKAVVQLSIDLLLVIALFALTLSIGGGLLSDATHLTAEEKRSHGLQQSNLLEFHPHSVENGLSISAYAGEKATYAY